MIKSETLRWEIILDYQGGPILITKVLTTRRHEDQLTEGNAHISLGREHTENAISA